jgi:sodium transport system permease protein
MARKRHRGLGPVLLTLGKELRETVRDRRTLTVMILFPLVVYPLLALVGTQLVAQRERGQAARASKVAVDGTGALADEVRARIDADRKLFERQATGTSGEVDLGRLDALVRVTAAPGAGTAAGNTPGPQGTAEIVLDATRDESRRAEERLSSALAKIWPAGCAPRLEVDTKDVAPRSRMGGYILSKALPLMILLMVLLGAFYPAIDVTAGERERGTLETVLVAPIPRLSLLFGKVLAVTVLASASGFLNLLSMSLTLVQVVNLAAPEADLPVPWIRAAATGLVVLPTAFLLAALFVAVGSLARGFKEAQNLLVPVYFAFFAPAMLGAMGDLTLSTGLGLVPGLNVSLLARDIALGKAGPGDIAVVLGATILWGALALAVAAKLYVSERFIAATDEGGKPGRSWRQRWSVPLTDTPLYPGDAFTAFGVAYLLLYFVFMPLQRRDLISGLLVTQWVGMLGLAVIYPLVNRRRPTTALGLAPPATLTPFLGAALIGVGAWVLANAAAQWVLPPPKEYLDAFRKMLFPEIAGRGVLVNLLLFALTPAICEELLFRGVILRALLSRTSPLVAIAVSAAMFGIFHVDIYRLLPTTLLGMVLGFIAWRSGSIWPSMLAHFLNNGVLLVLGSLGVDHRIDALGAGGKAGLFAAALLVVALGTATLSRRRATAA